MSSYISNYMGNYQMNMKQILRLLLLFCGGLGGNVVNSAEVTGVGNFSHIVADLNRSIEFYGEVLGLDPNTSMTAFSDNPAIMQLGNTPGAESRIASFSIPGTEIGIELVEYKDIGRQPIQTRFQDPGAAVIQLRLRDLDVVLERLASSQYGSIWTPSGLPVNLGEIGRIIFLKDPDGFFVELIETAALDDKMSVGGNIYNASFELIINNTEQNARFYQAGLGLTLQVSEEYDDTPLMTNTVSALGAAFRRSSLTIPGGDVAMTFLEFKDITRQPMVSRIQDPGTAILQLKVDDVAAMTKQLVRAGGTLITQGGAPVDVGGGFAITIVRDLNNLFLELMPER